MNLFRVYNDIDYEPNINIGYYSTRKKALEKVQKYLGVELFLGKKCANLDVWYVGNNKIIIEKIELDKI